MSANDKLAATFHGPQLATAVRAVKDIHKPVPFYDECDCAEGVHPDEYEYIDTGDYIACPASFTGYGCEACCTSNDYSTEDCPHGGGAHTEQDSSKCCPTMEAITNALEPTP